MDKIIKQETMDTKEEIPCEPVAAISYEAVAAPVTVKKTKAKKKHKSAKSSGKIEEEVPPLAAGTSSQSYSSEMLQAPVVVKKENGKKMPKVKEEKDVYTESPCPGVFPYRSSVQDFYCHVCCAHMHSVPVWQSHLKGKRHLKNVRKRSVEKDANGANAPVSVKKEPERVDVADGLFYIDNVGAKSPPVDCNTFKSPVSSADTTERQYCSPHPLRLSHSPPNTKSVSLSSSVEMSFEDIAVAEVMALPPLERLNFLKELSDGCVPETEDDKKNMQSIIAALAEVILQYETRQLCCAAQKQRAV